MSSSQVIFAYYTDDGLLVEVYPDKKGRTKTSASIKGRTGDRAMEPWFNDDGTRNTRRRRRNRPSQRQRARKHALEDARYAYMPKDGPTRATYP